MKRREQNPGGSSEVVTLLIVAGGAYLAYTYLQSSGLWAQWFGGAATTGGMPTLATIEAGLQSGAFVGAGTDGSGNVIVHQAATGAYYAVNPTTGIVSAASGPGTLAVSNPATTPPPSQPVSSAPSTSTQTQLAAMAQQYMTNMAAAGTPVQGLNADQWLYYYQIITRGANPANIASFTITPQQGESVILALGLTDATRGTIISMQQFLNALGSAGVSGIISVPNGGPIRSPMPTTQSFSGGYGGYGTGGKRGGYLN